MKTPIPNLGEYKPKKGKKMIYCGKAGELEYTHTDIEFRRLNLSKDRKPEIWTRDSELFLTKKEWKRLNAEFQEKEEAKPRDLSGVQYILDLLTPEVRERVIELANDPKDLYYKKHPNPLFFIDLFTWAYTDENHAFWKNINNAIKDPDLRKGHPAFNQIFEWRKDAPPTIEDTDSKNRVSVYQYDKGSKAGWVSIDHWIMQSGMPWAPTSETEQFTDSNPAPSPFEQ